MAAEAPRVLGFGGRPAMSAALVCAALSMRLSAVAAADSFPAQMPLTEVTDAAPVQNPVCQHSLKALSGCTVRLAAEAACSTAQLLNNSIARSVFGCVNASLVECSARCLDRLGTLGLPLNSSDAQCSTQEQLMKQYTGSPQLVVEFIPDPRTGLARPMLLPASLVASQGLPTLTYFGDYQRCLYGENMQYCLVEGLFALGPAQLHALMGVCRPSSCSEDEIHDDIKPLLGTLQVQSTGVTCHRATDAAPPVEWTTGRGVALGVFAALGALALAGTALGGRVRGARDVLAADPREQGRPRAASSAASLLSAFSVSRNLESFRKIRAPGRDADMSVLDGLRVVSTAWVVLGHTLIWPLLSIQYENAAMVLPPKGRLTETAFQIVPGGYFAVDTFFWLSGFLGARTLHAKVWKSPSLLSPCGFCFRFFPMALFARWLRLSVALGFLLLFTQTWYREIGKGGLLWNIQTGLAGGGCLSSVDNDGCKTYWWSQLLYINTIYPKAEMGSGCFAWTWYLANDMQLFLLVPFLVLLRERAGKAVAWCSLVALTAASILGATWVIWHNQLVSDPVFGNIGGQNADGMSFGADVYEAAWWRAAPYLVGVASAWILDAEVQSRQVAGLALHGQASADGAGPAPLLGGVDIEGAAARAGGNNGFVSGHRTPPCQSVLKSAVLQLLSLAAMCFVVFYPVTRYQCATFQECLKVDTAPWPEWFNAVYGGTNHAIWGFGLACLMHLRMVKAPGTGWMAFLLGADFWQPISKLTYSAYLLHPLVIVFFYCSQDQSLRYLDVTFFSNFVAFVTVTFVCAFVLWLFVEKPGANLSAVLLGALAGRKEVADA